MIKETKYRLSNLQTIKAIEGFYVGRLIYINSTEGSYPYSRHSSFFNTEKLANHELITMILKSKILALETAARIREEEEDFNDYFGMGDLLKQEMFSYLKKANIIYSSGSHSEKESSIKEIEKLLKRS